ncbi:MAG: hypothetical protein AB4352_20720 [Hormoscilla sp.]
MKGKPYMRSPQTCDRPKHAIAKYIAPNMRSAINHRGTASHKLSGEAVNLRMPCPYPIRLFHPGDRPIHPIVPYSHTL